MGDKDNLHASILLETCPSLSLNLRALRKLMRLHHESIMGNEENPEVSLGFVCLQSALFACLARQGVCEIVCLLCEAASHYVRSRGAVCDEFVLTVCQSTLYFASTEKNPDLESKMRESLLRGVVINGYRYCGTRALDDAEYMISLRYLENASDLMWSVGHRHSQDFDLTVSNAISMLKAYQGLRQTSDALHLARGLLYRLPDSFQSPQLSLLVSYAVVLELRLELPAVERIDSLISWTRISRLYLMDEEMEETKVFALVLLAQSLCCEVLGNYQRASYWSARAARILEDKEDEDYRLQTVAHLIAGDHLTQVDMVHAVRTYGKARSFMGLQEGGDHELLQTCLGRRLDRLEKDEPEEEDSTSVTYDSDCSLNHLDYEAQELQMLGFMLC